MAGFSAGVGRRALEEFIAVADCKHRGPSPTCVADDEVVQHLLAIVDADMRAARSFFVDAISTAWDTVNQGDACTLRQRATVMAAAQTIHRASITAIDTVLPRAGTSALAFDRPIQRCFRDLHAASHHIFFNVDTMKHIGQVALGRTPVSPRF
jgi:alkylation response protein AidB-like acyl-CoA dehydrogenase